jgi:hypothetical protein
MAKKRSPPLFKKIIFTILLLLLGVFLYISYQIWHYTNIKPINSSQTYYKDPFGTIYEDATTGCFDVCIIKTFKILPVDKSTFEVLMVKSPFTRLHKKGELIESQFAKDKSKIFWRARQIVEADSPSFIALSYDLGRDKKQYYLYDEPLQTYIAKEFGQANQFPPESLEVLSYDPINYIVLKVDNNYYFVKLNPQPKSIEKIILSTAIQYPKLQ